MTKTITTYDPEFDEVLRELSLSREAIERRRNLSDESFREWLFDTVRDIAHRLGFVIQNIAEFTRDMTYGFKKGFAEGRQEARNKSIRAREGRT